MSSSADQLVVMHAGGRVMSSRMLRPRARRGFTLVELIIAGVLTAFLLGSLALSFSQLGRARNTSKLRFDAHIRADAALNMIRKDIAAVLRRDDLFFTRLLLIDDSARVGSDIFERDGILVFNTRLRAVRDIDFNGEGMEYETQYRIEEDEAGPALWVRHDAMPDEYPLGGGVVSPAVEGVVAMMIEAYDGEAWYGEWDSDLEGLPLAIRISIVASGHRDHTDVYTAPRATLRTIISIDRVIPPKDLFKDPDEEEEEAMDDGSAEEEGAEGGENGGDGGGDDDNGTPPPDIGGGGSGRPRPTPTPGGGGGGPDTGTGGGGRPR